MQEKIAKLFEKHSFWLALLCHMLLLTSFSISLAFIPLKDKSPSMYVPSYLYQTQTSPTVQPQKPQKNIETSKRGIEKPVVTKSNVLPRPDQFQAVNSPQDEMPVHLIGEKKVDAPLLKLLGQAITAHLIFPKIALDFNLRGVVLIRFVVHPDGRITDIQMVKSSSAGVLDESALAAIHSMSPVYNVGKYVDKPTPIVFGIIFG